MLIKDSFSIVPGPQGCHLHFGSLGSLLNQTPAATSWSSDRRPAERLVPLGEGRGFLRDWCPGLHPSFVFEAALASPAWDGTQTSLRTTFRASVPSETETFP